MTPTQALVAELRDSAKRCRSHHLSPFQLDNLADRLDRVAAELERLYGLRIAAEPEPND